MNLSDLKGKWVLVDFWASWCRACRIENPKFARLYKKFNSSGFEIISISKDDSESNWKKAINKDGVDSWTHIWDKDKSISDAYSISSLPQNVVISPDGKVAAKNVSAEMLHSFLETNL
ncbi:MAG: TlpA family protein disulfide reductase [Ekhidna sp.]|nr:TlpA family protein disulfide reductase [Ekhidna sp.]